MTDRLESLIGEALIEALDAHVRDLVHRLVAQELEQRLAELAPPRWMTVAEAAEYARCSIQHIYDLRSDGRLSRHGGRGHAVVDRLELDAYLDNSRGGRGL